MKGLLIKDLCVLKKQLKIMFVFMIVYSYWAVSAKTPSLMGTVVILLSIMMPITSLSYDESSQWYRYCFSLPVSRRTLVLSKYVLGFLLALVGLALSAIGNVIVLALTGGKDAMATWIATGVFLEVGVIFLSLMLPILFRFGVEKGRLLMMLFSLLPAMLVPAFVNMMHGQGIPFPSGEFWMALLISSPLFTLAVFLVSFRISVSIVRGKEY